jgi:uncharacterized protein YqjF (DUF2071 family)
MLDKAVDFLRTPARQTSTLSETAHRPWPVPERPWVLAQTWHDLLFAHWRVPIAAVRRHVPAELPVDEYDGSGWVGVTPFRLGGLRARWTYPAPALSAFAELNVRTYVTIGGRPGIFFFSLDAASVIAVAGARTVYRLPYFWARMSVRRRDARIEYRSRRRGESDRRFVASYAPEGPELQAVPGSLEYFLTERYCLYTVSQSRIVRAEIHHPPWRIRAAGADVEANTMPPPGLRLEGEPLLHFAKRQDVLVWPPAYV